MVFLDFHQEPGLYSHVTARRALQNSCLFSDARTPVSLRGTPRDSFWARNHNRESDPGEAETQGPFAIATGKLGFLSIFKITQVSSHFEALNSEGLSRCQRDVRTPLVMR